MTSIMRRTVRGTAAGLGALAIVAGTAACGGLIGGGDGEEGPPVEQEEPADEGEAEEEKDPAEDEGDDSQTEEDGEDSGSDLGGEGDAEDSDDADDSEEPGGSEDAEDDAEDAEDAGDADASEDGDDSAGALSEDDLTAVSERYFEFLKAAAEGDGTAACSMVLNPYTDQPMEGAVLEACAKGFEGEAENSDIDPSALDGLDPSMFEAVDNGDGTAGITAGGADAGITFLKGEDGNWYLDGSDYV